MANQARLNVQNQGFILYGNARIEDGQTVVQDAGRGAADMVRYTVMAKDPTTGKWTSLTDVAAVDGTSVPRGILVHTIAAADIVAGDVTGVEIWVGGSIDVSEEQLVLENSLTLATEITAANPTLTIREALKQIGIYPRVSTDIGRYENA